MSSQAVSRPANISKRRTSRIACRCRAFRCPPRFSNLPNGALPFIAEIRAISFPAGSIPAGSATARYLVQNGEDAADLNVYASRRGNFEAMVRGVFTNLGVKNLLCSNCPPGFTAYGDEVVPLTEAAARYAQRGLSTVIVAGERYGAGSSRDWAAKGPALLGVRTVLAKSFERIHRQNLIGMGIVPLVLAASLDIGPHHTFEIDLGSRLEPGVAVKVTLRCGSAEEEFAAMPAVETEMESDLVRMGGIAPYILDHAGRKPAHGELEITY